MCPQSWGLEVHQSPQKQRGREMLQWSLLYVEIFLRTHQRGCRCLGLDPTLAGWGLLLFPAQEALASLPIRVCARTVSGLLGSLPCPGGRWFLSSRGPGEPCSWELPAQSCEAITTFFIPGTKLAGGQSLGWRCCGPSEGPGWAGGWGGTAPSPHCGPGSWEAGREP